MATSQADDIGLMLTDDEALIDDEAFTDDELTAQALAADPDADVADDAVPLSDLLAAGASSGGDDLLPGWYMPVPMGGGLALSGWRRRIVLLIVISFVLINAYGLCSTYGHVGFD